MITSLKVIYRISPYNNAPAYLTRGRLFGNSFLINTIGIYMSALVNLKLHNMSSFGISQLLGYICLSTLSILFEIHPSG